MSDYSCGRVNTITHFVLMDIHQRSTFILQLSHQRCWEQWYSLSCCHAGGERSPACITDVTIAPLFYLFVLQQAEEVHVADEIIRELSLALQRNLYVVPLVIQITAQDTHCHTADSHWGWCAVGLKQQQGAGLKSTFLPSFLFFSSFCTISSDNGVWHKERCCSILDI